MTYTPKDNTGSLFVNDRKTAENHPDHAGSIMVDGTEYWLNGWLKKTKDGKPYLSLSIKRKDGGGGSVKQDMDDAIPFAPEWR